MLTKSGKISFVDGAKRDMKAYRVVGVVRFDGLPDRLVQLTKNRLKPGTRFIMGRKSLLRKILEAHPKGAELSREVGGTSCIILSNEDPFDLYKRFKSNSIKLSAKPGQVAPADVNVESGETSIMPGQAVTELKAAGIDVQIQKGKVVIAKSKTLVKKGETISTGLAKALHTLEIQPFSAVVDPMLLAESALLYTRDVLKIDAAWTAGMIAVAFRGALALSLDRGIANQYTINSLIAKAYNNALCLGVEAKLYDSGIIERIIAKAASEAAAVGAAAKAHDA